MYAQFFGNYLLSHNIITQEQLICAMQKKASQHLRLGTLAIHAGYMTGEEVDLIVIMQTHQDKRFGELAVTEGYLTQAQVTELLKAQKANFLLLGQALVDDGIISNTELQSLILDYQSANEISDIDFSEETRETITRLVQNFFTTARHPLSTIEISYIRLLLNNMVRFIGDDFTLVSPSECKEYPTNYCVSQSVIGNNYSFRTYIDLPEPACVAFASRYVGDSFNSFDEYVQASLEDFLNLHNGLFIVNTSNDYGIEMQLDVPTVQQEVLATFEHEAYLIPIIYPFGTIHIIFELNKINE